MIEGPAPPGPGALDDPAYGRPERSALGGNVRRGLAWKGASQLTAQIARTSMTIILAHLLTPRDFGLAGMVLIFSGLIQLLTDVGFSASLVQLKTITEADRSTAFWFSMFLSLACFGVAVLVSPYVASFYGQPRLRWMFVAIASGLLTGSLTTTQASLLWRSMNFRALETRAMAAAVASAVVGIAAAVGGLGAWSLILQALALSAASTITIWIFSPWKPQFMFSRESLRRMARFSSNVFFSRFLTYGDRNLDNLLVGRFLGSAPLGIYSLSYSVILIPFERIVSPVQNVLYPAFATIQDDLKQMRALWLRGVRVIATIMFPAMAGVIVVAPDFVSVVLGRRWTGATTIVQIFAWVALIQSLTILNSAVWQSRSKTGLLLRFTACAFALDATAFVVGLHFGVRGVAIGYAITNTVAIVPVGLFIMGRLLEVRPTAFIGELRGVIEATVVMAAATWALRHELIRIGVDPGIRLPAAVLAGIAVYVLMCLWRERRAFEELDPRRFRTIATP